MIKKLNYFKRIYKAYLTGEDSQLTFWHGTPALNQECKTDELGQYYMPFSGKADYSGPYDSAGIPLLDYHGAIGIQYNPVAIAQYGLGNYNQFYKGGKGDYLQKFFTAADWLVDNLVKNEKGISVWMHHFDFEYRDLLIAPWYSGLAQGQGLSVLVRAYKETGDKKYLKTANLAYDAFRYSADEGGVVSVDKNGDTWIEEYIVDPPTHVLNGYIWAAWGIYDYYLITQLPHPRNLFERSMQTIKSNIHLYDIGFWSLYEQAGTNIKMIASHFYHSLHIIQLEVLYKITKDEVFSDYAKRWKSYQENQLFKIYAFLLKGVFKIFYY